MADYLGQVFGNYRLLRVLGKGSFADVYLGKHLYLKTEAAIKVLYGRLDPEAVESFLKEAHVLHSIEHPHIVRIYDASMIDGVPYLVMDYASGGTLRDRHPRGVAVPLPTIVSYVKQIAAALDYAHEHKLIHRDLKPENLLFNQAGEVLLSDFGVALPMRNTDSMSVQALGGTLAYIAPEQIRGKPCGASDQYALGIMVYEWLCGQRPFSGEVAELLGQHLFVAPSSLCAKIPELPVRIEQVIFKILAKEHQQRFANVGDFARALEEASLGKEISVPFDGLPAPVQIKRDASTSRPAQPDKQKRQNLLPTRLTRLIGREGEREAACVMLVKPEVRLLTMTGPGGIGKTSLALSIASDVQHVFADGVCYIPLVTVSDPDLVLPAIFQALGFSAMGEASTVGQLVSVLRDQQGLLVLDNFEQITDAAPVMLDILQRCPQLKMLITSRIVLHIPGEHTFPVPPLARPDLRKSRETFASSSSVQLFCERAREHKAAFELTEENTQAVAEICTRLDGLPLAIELAAARIQTMTPQLLLSRLKRRLDLLASTSKILPERQQTIRKTIHWSYDLLQKETQILLRRLAVFRGGCRMMDIEALYEILGDDPFAVMDHVTYALDNSLVYQVKQEKGEERLHMLETIREFGLEQLEGKGELEKVRAAHAAYYQSLMPVDAPISFNVPESEWSQLVRSEFENMLAALHYLKESRHYKNALEFATAMGGLWMMSGFKQQGMIELTEVIRLCEENGISMPVITKASALTHAGIIGMLTPNPVAAQPFLQGALKLLRPMKASPLLPLVLVTLSVVIFDLGDYEQTERLLQETSAWVQETGIKEPMTRVLVTRTWMNLLRGDYEQVHIVGKQCLEICREVGDVWMEALTLHFMGWTAYHQKAYLTARRTYSEKAVEMFRTLKFPNWGIESLVVLAYELLALGETQKAQQLLEEARSRGQEAGEAGDTANALCGLGRMAMQRGDLQAAQSLFEESITTIERLKVIAARYKYILACGYEGLAVIALQRENLVWAAYLLGAADAQRRNGPYYNPVGLEVGARDQVEAEARLVLGEEAFMQAWIWGQRMTPAQALAARENAPPNAIAQTPAKVTDTGSMSWSSLAQSDGSEKDLQRVESLTKREMDVLRLLAAGQSNAEIAENLVLSVVTVNSYLRSIYSKLGVSSRMKAVNCAREYSLLA